jgi:tropinone reductase I
VRDRRWSLEGHTALITGASRGIGLAIAEEFALLGAHLRLVSRHEDTLEHVSDSLAQRYPLQSVEMLSADMSDGEGRASVIDWLHEQGGENSDVHILVNNVGDNIRRAMLEYSDQDLQHIFSTNVASCFELSRLLHPFLKRSGRGSIINIASVSGMTHVRTGAAYGMSKAAIVQLSKNLACEWAGDGIRVNAVAPWYIRTARTQGALDSPEYLAAVLAQTPMRRIGEPHEVAAAVAFLALPCASYITGECIAVDGGFLRYGF